MLLDTQKNRHLLERFGERRSPSATRFHYALSAIEDNVITELEAELTRVGLGGCVMTYMFVGCVVRVKAEHLDTVIDAVEKVELKNSVAFTVKDFA